jgi:hypothetical protein
MNVDDDRTNDWRGFSITSDKDCDRLASGAQTGVILKEEAG